MIKSLQKMISGKEEKKTKPRDLEWERFQKSTREQFLRLRKKGLSIQVITL